jgi:hypothetical protein
MDKGTLMGLKMVATGTALLAGAAWSAGQGAKRLAYVLAGYRDARSADEADSAELAAYQTDVVATHEDDLEQELSPLAPTDGPRDLDGSARVPRQRSAPSRDGARSQPVRAGDQ